MTAATAAEEQISALPTRVPGQRLKRVQEEHPSGPTLQGWWSQQLFDAAPIALAVVDRGLRIARANRAFGDGFGVTPDRLIGMAITGTPGAPAGLGEALADVLRTGERVTLVHGPVEGGPRWRVTYLRLETPSRPPVLGVVGLPTGAAPGGDGAGAVSDAHVWSLVDAAVDMVQLADPDGTVRFVTPGVERVLGWEAEDLIGRHFTQILHPEEIDGARQAVADSFTSRQARTIEHRVLTRDREVRWFEVAADARDIKPGVPGLVLVWRDVTQRRVAANALQHSEERFRLLVEGIQEMAVIMLDHSGRVERWNAGAEQLFGYTAEEVLGREFSRFAGAVDDHGVSVADELAEARASGHVQQQSWRRRADGSRFRAQSTVSTLLAEDGSARGFLEIVRDVTEQYATEGALRHQALHDGLTGLPNRTLFHDRLQKALSMARRRDWSLALLILDLDRFKNINDVLGHDAGDRVLTAVAARLRDTLRDDDTVARLGGDEFAVVLPEPVDPASARQVADKLLDAIHHPLGVEGLRDLRVGASIGIALYPVHAVDEQALLRRADTAMYRAKSEGLGAAVYDPSLDRPRSDRLQLADELGQAIDADELTVEYLPTFDLGADDIVGLEALVRWHHPERGDVPAEVLAAMADESGLSEALTLSMLRTALAQCAAWRAAGRDLSVAVNLCERNLDDDGFVGHVLAALEDAGVPADQLELELTERMVQKGLPTATATLGQLAEAGIRLVLDDFGTGLTSLSQVQQLPLSGLKIDKSFVRVMRTDPGARSVVASILDVGRNLDVRVVAEGIEDAATLAAVRELGCRYGQGFHLRRPAPADRVLPRGDVQPGAGSPQDGRRG